MEPNPTRVVHCKREDYDVYIGRPSRWGNPYSHKDDTKAEYKVATVEEAIEGYRNYLKASIKSGEVSKEELAELYGKTLGCWCKPDPCHGEVIARAAEWAYRELNSR